MQVSSLSEIVTNKSTISSLLRIDGLGVIFSCVRATKLALVGVSLLSAADVAAFDFFCAEFGQGQKTIRFACLSLKAVIFTALKSLRRSTANARNHWHDSLRNTDKNHTRWVL
jgi:hypothetical protein